MATLCALTLYPVKSCAGIALDVAVLTRAGLQSGTGADLIHDREWMVVDPAGRFVSQREHPRMALIRPALVGSTLQLTAPGLAPLVLPLARAAGSRATVHLWDDDLAAADCGDGAAAWLSAFLGTPCWLVRFDPAVERLSSIQWTAGVAAPNRFSDGYPVLVAGSASLDDLNEKLQAAGRPPLPMNRFRPNVEIDGIGPFEEDYVDTFELPGIVLKPVKPCPRCPIPSVDQTTGLIGPDPLDVLRPYRAKAELDGAICFGINCIVVDGDGLTLRVGQEIDANLAF